MTQINAYIGFNGDCRRAMEFYRDCIGGELSVQTIGESTMSEECPADMKNTIVHAALIRGSMVLMATGYGRPGWIYQGE